MCWRCLHDCASSRATAGLQARAGWCARRCRRRTGRAFSRLATGQTIIRALVLTSGLFGLCAPVGVDVGVVVAQQRPRRPRVLRGEGNLCVREREGGRERGREEERERERRGGERERRGESEGESERERERERESESGGKVTTTCRCLSARACKRSSFRPVGARVRGGCVRACVRACARACVRWCVCAGAYVRARAIACVRVLSRVRGGCVRA